MPQAAIIQERETSIVAAITSQSLAFSSSVTAGSSFHVGTSCDGTHTNTSADNVNGSHGPQLDSVLDAGAGELVRHFKLDNSASGTITVSSTITAGNSFASLWIREIGPTSGYTGAHSGNLQTNPVSTATDAITSGSVTPSVPGLLSALSTDIFGNTTPVLGSGFTTGPAGWDFGLPTKAGLTESKHTSTTALAGTFTSTNGGDDFITVAAHFGDLETLMGQICH